MTIKGVEILELSLELKNPYQIAYHSFDHAEHLFIRLDTGTLSAWGCLAPDPFVTGEEVSQMLPEIQDRLPALLKGSDPFRRARIMNQLKKAFPRYFSLWAAVDMALWDLLGKQAGMPLWKVLGGFRSRIETSVTISICPLRETLDQADDFLARGFRILKIKGGVSMEEDVERLVKLRERFGSSIRLRFDANQGYTRDQSMDFLKQVHDLDLELLEQPTRKGEPELMGSISHGSMVPIMADESLVSLIDAFKLAKRGLVDMLNIKIMKVGGISEAIQVDSVARSARMKVMVGCMDESALGIAAGLHFALSRKNILYADLDGHLDIKDDPAAGTLELKKGFLFPSNLPGLGWKGF